jgi:DNA-binding winged helix-turn-helix (wHTH) protein/Tol biopolymer transport system component
MNAKAFVFGDFRLDPSDCKLLAAGEPVPLTPKAFDLLLLLIENRGRLIEKETLMKRLWPDAFVDEANLANNISLLRKALGDSANMIQTVPRRGYRFVGDVREEGAPPAVAVPERRLRRRPVVVAATMAVLAVVAAFFAGRAIWRRELPRFTQVTFRRGLVWSARFAPDGQTIVYSAAHEGKPAELFLTRAGQAVSRPLNIANAHLLAISSRGELALMTKPREMLFIAVGTLARVPLAGGAPREIATGVQDADWSPDGNQLALIRWNDNVIQIEYPAGRVLYKTPLPVWMSAIRVSPGGDQVAFLLHESAMLDDRGRVIVLDSAGTIVRRSREFASASGLAWRGDEIVVSASATDMNNDLYSINRIGAEHLIARGAGRFTLFDAAHSGTILASHEDGRIGIIIRAPGESSERELSWLDGSWIRDISADGRTILFDEESTGGGSTARVLTRTVDGAPATDLGPGNAVALSPDGKWALARQRFMHPPRLVLIPTGAGQPRVVRTGNVEPAERVAFTPDGRYLVMVGNVPGRPQRTYLCDLTTGQVRPLTSDGVLGMLNDGVSVIAKRKVYPFAGGPPKPIPSLQPDERIVRFDGKYVWTSTDNAVFRIDLATGQRDRITDYRSGRPQQSLFTGPPILSADGRAYAYTYVTGTSDLYVVEGARAPMR